MQYISGLYWPDSVRQKDVDFMLKRQKHALGVIPYTKGHKTMVQAGGCIGLYPIIMSKFFDSVYTFEPDADNYACLIENTSPYGGKITPFNMALGKELGNGFFTKARYATGKLFKDPGEGLQKVTVFTIDSLALDSCDAIQLDVEGGELDALTGALQTIRKFKPVIQIEVSGEHKRNHELDPCHGFLTQLGYSVVREIGKDTVYCYD